MPNLSHRLYSAVVEQTDEKFILSISIRGFFTLYCEITWTLSWIVTLVQAGIWVYWILEKYGLI